MTAIYPDEEQPAAAGSPADPMTLHVVEHDEESWRQDFTGLLFAGALDGWFDWCGHRIELRTLTTDEELLVAQLMREYEGGMGASKSYALGIASLCVTSIDHQPMPVPLGEHPNKPYKWAQERFGYGKRWYPPTVDAIFDAYLQLEARQRAVLASLGKASGPEGNATPGLSATSASPSAGDS